MIPQLPEDCIREIVQYLSDSPFDLFSCLLVNKTWFICAISILWKNPWKHNKYLHVNITNCSLTLKGKVNHLTFKNHHDYKIFWKVIGKTILKCLPYETKQLFIHQGIPLNPSLLSQPKFNYIIYLQKISHIYINLLVDNIFDGFESLIECKRVVTKELWKYMLQECKRVKTLMIPNDISFLKYNDDMKEFFKSIDTLVCSIKHSKNMYQEIKGYGLSLQKLKILTYNSYYNDELEDLIRSQSNLQELQIIDDDGNNKFDFIPSNSLEISPITYLYSISNVYDRFIIHSRNSLKIIKVETKVYTLDHLKRFIQTIVNSCPNLEVIIIHLDKNRSHVGRLDSVTWAIISSITSSDDESKPTLEFSIKPTSRGYEIHLERNVPNIKLPL
ncbi:3917_t:CDS:1 [Funneliformis caledonium]|uniref:3917_t:CDS:1 n=1 Tax=Funneliformis caledonium TaxID=1117310 RepID=A0A9N8ZVT8_9GLOM|nr:3917_t:CDS:1 [Funneliformis caledonium]